MGELWEVLLKGVEEDLDACTTIGSRTSSSRSAIRGFGSLSSKAIMSVGSLLLGGVSRINVRRTLNRIAEEIKEYDVSEESCGDLLEFQRPGLYPESVRREAWRFLLIVLHSRDADTVSSVVDIILKWPRVDLQIFARELAACNLLDWPLFPPRSRNGSIADDGKVREKFYNQRPYSADDPPLLQSFREIMLGILTADPSALHEMFTFTDFATLVLSPPQDRSTTRDFLSLFTQFINVLVDYSPKPTSGRSSRFELTVDCIVGFLSTGPLANLSLIASHILASIRPFTRHPLQNEECDPILERHPVLVGVKVTHPTWPFLHLAALLSYESKDAADLFISNGLFGLINDLWRHDFPEPGWASSRYPDKPMSVGCLVALGGLAKLSAPRDFLETLAARGEIGWLHDEAFPRALQYNQLRRPAGGALQARFYLPAARAILALLEHSLLHDETHIFRKQVYDYLIAVLSMESLGTENDAGLKHYAAQVLLCSAITPQSYWANIVDVLRRTKGTNTSAVFSCVVQYCLRCADIAPLHHSDESVQALHRMYNTAKARGFSRKNPVHRFLLLSRLCMSSMVRVRVAIGEARLSTLIQDVVNGRFDFISDSPITDDERAERLSELYQFKNELESGHGSL